MKLLRKFLFLLKGYLFPVDYQEFKSLKYQLVPNISSQITVTPTIEVTFNQSSR